MISYGIIWPRPETPGKMVLKGSPENDLLGLRNIPQTPPPAKPATWAARGQTHSNWVYAGYTRACAPGPGRPRGNHSWRPWGAQGRRGNEPFGYTEGYTPYIYIYIYIYEMGLGIRRGIRRIYIYIYIYTKNLCF